MKAFLDPLDKLREALRWFMAVPELKLLHIHTGEELRMAAVEQISAAPLALRQKRSLVVFTDTPVADGADDWNARTQQVQETFADWRNAAIEHGISLREPRVASVGGLHGFAATLNNQVAVLPDTVGGLVVCLAPSSIADPVGWASDVRSLLQTPPLAPVRFILMEGEPAPALALTGELGPRADRVDIRIDPGATTGMLELMLAGMKTAPLGADPQRTVGMAGPREAPPARRTKATPATVAASPELLAAGISPAMLDQSLMQGLRIELLSASLAQQAGRAEEGLQHQARARDLAMQAGLFEQAAMLDLMLGSHLLMAGGHAAAEAHFDRVIQQAHGLGSGQLEAQAYMAKAGAQLMQKKQPEAAASYTRGGRVAEASGKTSIAIECYRMDGQISLTLGNERAATEALNKALVLAKGLANQDAALSSAPEAASQLAAIYEKNGLHPHAHALRAQIAEWKKELERPAPPPASDAAIEAQQSQKPSDASGSPS